MNKKICKNCWHWKKNHDSKFGYCEFLNDRKFIYPEVEDCMDVSERTIDFCNYSHETFGCILFLKK